MGHVSNPGPEHEQFAAWAKSQGVHVDGIAPAYFEGRRLGIRAQRNIEAGEQVIQVPASALISVKTLPTLFKERHEQISVNGILASFLAFGGEQTKQYAAWKNSWPSWRDLEESLPLLWPAAVRELLLREGLFPPAIGGWRPKPEEQNLSDNRTTPLLQKQEGKLHADWSVVSKNFPQATFQNYAYYWCIVNTRSFYWEFPDEELPKDFNDRIVLVPFADYFNHCDDGQNSLSVAYDADGYAFTTDREYSAGEELFTSYGGHNNDFLLTEYGFILDINRWDSLPLDEFFSGNKIPEAKKEQLKNAGYWGNYNLNKDGVCHRTQVAVRSQTTNLARWKQFVNGKPIDKDREDSKADAYIVKNILEVYYEKADRAMRQLDEQAQAIPAGIRATLTCRWYQIQDMIKESFKNGIQESVQSLTLGPH